MAQRFPCVNKLLSRCVDAWNGLLNLLSTDVDRFLPGNMLSARLVFLLFVYFEIMNIKSNLLPIQ